MALLSSKIRVPVLPGYSVPRRRLLTRLNERSVDLILLQAPAGYGKSVLAAQYAVAKKHTAAWLYLEPEDGEPRRFCRYLAGALAEALPALAETEVVSSTKGADFEPNHWMDDLLLFFQEFEHRPTLLVLDNFESVGDDPVVLRLTERLAHGPTPRLSLLITARRTPHIGVRRLAAQGRALVLGEAELAFDLGEFQAAARALGSTLREEELEEQWSRSEGWCVFLSLGTDLTRAADRGSPDYLEEEILGRLAPDLLDAMRAACILDVVTPEGWSALGLVPNGFARWKRALAETGIPHVTVPGPGAVRLHPMLRGRLLSELSRSPNRDAVADRAGAYFRETHQPEAGIRVLTDLGAFEAVLDTLFEEWPVLFENDLIPRVGGWLQRLPDRLRTDPRAVVIQTRYLKFLGEHRRLIEYVEGLRAAGDFPGDPDMGSEIWTTEAFARTLLAESPGYDSLLEEWRAVEAGSTPAPTDAAIYTLTVAALYELRMDASLAHAEEALSRVPAASIGFRTRSQNNKAVILHEMGRSEEAVKLFTDSIDLCRREGEASNHSMNLIGRAHAYKDLGRFPEAIRDVDQGMDVARLSGATRITLVPHAARIRGEVLWHTGHAAAAFRELEAAYRGFENHNRYEALATGVLLDRWKHVCGQASNLVRDEDFTGAVSEARVRFLLHRSMLALAEAEYDAAVALAAEARAMAAEMPFWRSTTWFVEARARGGQGRRDEANAVLDRGLEILETHDRSIYALADPKFSSWIVAEAVAGGIRAERALRLAAPDRRVDLTPQFLLRLEDPGIPAGDKERLVAAAEGLGVRGLEEAIRASGLPAAVREAYAETVRDAALPPLSVRMLGAFECVGGGGEVRFPRRAARRILQMLLLEHPRSVHEERLIEALWPESDPGRAKRSLQTSVNELRRCLDPHHHPRGSSYVGYRDEHYDLELPPGTEVDLHAFRSEVRGAAESEDPARVDRLEHALSLYRGDLIEDAPYEEYTAEPREQLRSLMLDACALAARGLIETDPGRAVSILRLGLDRDPYWSEGVDLTMRCLSRQGRVLAAIRTYRDHQRRLERDLALPPDAPLERLFETLTGAA